LSRWKCLLSRRDSCGVMFTLFSKLLTVKINLIINTHEDRLRPVLDQSEYFQKCKDRGPDCGCGLLQSWEFVVLSVRVQSSSSLFPVVRLDFQTLVVMVVVCQQKKHPLLGHGTGNPGVSPGLPVPVPQQNPYPFCGYRFLWVGVTGFVINLSIYTNNK
jgi:hypothetical protein